MTSTPAPVERPSRFERLLGRTEPVRRALYPVVVAVVALLVAHGLVDERTAPLWLALGVAVLGIGGTEAARAVVYSPATVAGHDRQWRDALADEHTRGVAEGAERAGWRLVDADETDEPGEHATDRDVRVEQLVTEVLAAVDEPTGHMPAISRATRCREVEEGRRCTLRREHRGPHLMTTG